MWTPYLRRMSSKGLYDLCSREKSRSGVRSRLITCLMGWHLAVITRTEGAAIGACLLCEMLIGPGLPPEASSTHPRGPPALCWAFLHSWRDSASWAACFGPAWASCHSKQMAYSPFVRLSDSLTSGGSITSAATLHKMQCSFPITRRPECQVWLFSEKPESGARLASFRSSKDHNFLSFFKVARPHSQCICTLINFTTCIRFK